MPSTMQLKSTTQLQLSTRGSPAAFLLKTLLLIFGLTSVCFSASRWQWMNPIPQGNTLNDIIFVQGKFYAVGTSGTIMTSTDGRSWNINHVPPFTNLYSIAINNNRFVAVGDTGTIYFSIDGNTWEKQISNTRCRLDHIIYADGRFIAIGDSIILVSQDGTSWNRTYSDRKVEVMSVAYGKGRYIVAARNYNISPTRYFFMTSVDCNEWAQLDPVNVSTIHAISFVDDKFMALNFDRQLLISEDAEHWDTLAGDLQAYESIIKMNDKLLSYGTYKINISSDGKNWIRHLIDSTKLILGCAVGNGTAVAVGQSGLIAVSLDANSWDVISHSMNDTLTSIAYGNNRYVAVGDDHSVLTSPDGIIWTKNDTANGLQRCLNLFQVIFVDNTANRTNGFFLAAGSSGLATSPDGEHWTMLLPTPAPTFYSLCQSKERLVAVGEKGIIMSSSRDGSSWTTCSTGTTVQFKTVAYSDEISGGLFVAAGYSGIVFTSSDGITWTRRNKGYYDKFISLAAGNGRFVSIRWHENAGNGFADTVWTSTDGVLWEKKRTNTIAELLSIVFGGGKFVGVSRDGAIYESTDGISWSKPYKCSDSYFKGVSFTNDHFAVLGARSILFSSESSSGSKVLQKHLQIQKEHVSIMKQGREVTLRITGVSDPGNISSLQIFSPDGRRIKVQALSGAGRELCIPVSRLSPGLYIVKVVRHNGGCTFTEFLYTP
ncbi:MAG: hypothetical protein GX640_05545 [Fibrobacter sp.]|nr:hypothetical protein [Fibrobacter sp.]